MTKLYIKNHKTKKFYIKKGIKNTPIKSETPKVFKNMINYCQKLCWLEKNFSWKEKNYC